MQDTSRFDRSLLALCLYLMAAIYFFLFFAAAFLAHCGAGYWLSLRAELPLFSEWAYHVFVNSPLLAVLPVVIVEAVIGRLIYMVSKDRIFRFFLLGLCSWLWGLLALGFCCFAAAWPFGSIGLMGEYGSRYPGLFTTWVVVLFVIPPAIFAAIAIKQFLKSRPRA